MTNALFHPAGNYFKPPKLFIMKKIILTPILAVVVILSFAFTPAPTNIIDCEITNIENCEENVVACDGASKAISSCGPIISPQIPSGGGQYAFVNLNTGFFAGPYQANGNANFTTLPTGLYAVTFIGQNCEMSAKWEFCGTIGGSVQNVFVNGVQQVAFFFIP